MFTLKPLHETESPKSESQALSKEALIQIQAIIDASTRQVNAENAALRAEIMQAREEVLKASKRSGAQIMAIQINDMAIEKLSLPAPSYMHRMIRLAKLQMAGNSEMNPYLHGPKGCGKTVAGKLLSEALKLPFAAITFTSGASETWLMGRQLQSGYLPAPFVDFYENGGVFLGDELDRVDPNMGVCMNNALANGFFFNPIAGRMIKRHPNFVFVGAGNTLMRGGDAIYTAANRQDGSLMDRLVPIACDYEPELDAMACPDETLRELLVGARNKLRALKAQDTVSTRNLKQVYLQVGAGDSLMDALKSLTAGWPEELVKACKLDKAPEAKKASKTETPKATKTEAKAEAKTESEDYPF